MIVWVRLVWAEAIYNVMDKLNSMRCGMVCRAMSVNAKMILVGPGACDYMPSAEGSSSCASSSAIR